MKVQLWEKLPNNFIPNKINKALYIRDHLTLVGIWHLDPENIIFENTTKIILKIKELILEEKNLKSISAQKLSELTNINLRNVEVCLCLIYELIGFFSSASHSQDGLGFREVRFSNDDNAYDEFLKFENLETKMEEFSIRYSENYKTENNSSKISQSKIISQNFTFIDPNRINDLESINPSKFDPSKLIQLCKELNVCFKNHCYLSCAMLTRAIIDHVPPIFDCKKFSEVSNNYQGSKSFKDSMQNLNNSSRKIADNHLHTQIRKKVVIPNKTQVNFSNDLDVLLSEIFRVLK